MTVLLLGISLVAALGSNVVKKLYTGREKSLFGNFLYAAVGGLVSATVLLIWGGFGEASLFTVLLGTLFGAIISLQSVVLLAALNHGPMAYTTVIVSFSTLITALSGALFFGESLSPSKIVGIVLMLASFTMANGSGGNGGKRASVRWLLLCIVSFLSTGAIGIMQKVHQTSVYHAELNAFLILAFAVSTLLSGVIAAVLYLRSAKKTSESVSVSKGARLILPALMVISGICTGANHKLNLYLSGVIDSAIFFPVVNGGGLVLTTLAALVVFRERLSVGQWIGIGLGIASVVCLCVG